MDTNQGSLGGGEILEHVGQEGYTPTPNMYMDDGLIWSYSNVQWFAAGIVVLLILLLVLTTMRFLSIKSLSGKSRGLRKTVNSIQASRRYELKIMRQTRALNILTALVESTVFRSDKANKEYMQYCLERAGIMVLDGLRPIKYEEFNAIQKFCMVMMLIISGISMVFINTLVGFAMMLFSFVFIGYLPLRVVRGILASKDLEIKENFADFYLRIHNVLLSESNVALEGIMRGYYKICNSSEMKRFVDTCLHHISVVGEYEATLLIIRDYREIPEVGKLMRLIRQVNEGGDVRMELMGFSRELLDAQEYAIGVKCDKLIARAERSFAILYPILFQAILSVALIYMRDIKGAGSLF